MMRKTLMPFALLGLIAATIGCAGSGSSMFIATSKPIGTNRVAYVVAGSGSTDMIMSANLNGTDPQVHGVVSPNDTVWDVNSTGDRVLVAKLNSDGKTFDAYSAKLDGTGATRLTTIGFGDIECLRYSSDYSKLICSGIDDTEEAVIVTAMADGSAPQIVYGTARVAQFGPGSTLVIGGEADDDVRTPFVGTMQTDGSSVTQLAKDVDALHVDFFGANIVYSASVGGDASGVVGLFKMPFAGGAATPLFGAVGLNVDPKFSADGSRVFFVREGVGVMSVPSGGGAATTVIAESQLLGLIRVR